MSDRVQTDGEIAADIVWQDEPNPANKSQMNNSHQTNFPWKVSGYNSLRVVNDENYLIAECLTESAARKIVEIAESHAKMREALKVAMFALTSPIGDSEDALTAIIAALEESK